EPAVGQQLGQAARRPLAFESCDDVDEVLARGDPEVAAGLHDGVGRGEPLGGVHRTREQVVLATDRDFSDRAFHRTIVDLETAVFEAATNVDALILRVSGRFGELDALAQLPVVFVDPAVELVEERHRVLLPYGQSFGRRTTSRLLLDLVQLLDELERRARPTITEDERFVEAPAHVHHAPETTLRRYQGLQGAIGVRDEAAVALVIVDLNVGLGPDQTEPGRDLFGFPRLGELVCDEPRAAAETPQVAAEGPAFTRRIEHLDRRVIDPDADRVFEDGPEQRIGDRQQQRRDVAPVPAGGALGQLESHPRELVALTVDRQGVVALALDQIREHGGAYA